MTTASADDPITPLAQAHAADPQNPAARDHLWRGVMGLPEWHMLEHTDDRSPAQLLTGREGGRLCVLGYTSRARAEVARAHFGNALRDRRVGVVSVARAGATARACGEGGAEFMLFNQGTGGPGFGETLESIAAMQEYFHDELPEGCLDRLAAMALRIDQPAVWGRIHRQMARREQLALARMGPNDGPVVITVNGRRTILVFTHPARVEKGMRALRDASEGRLTPGLLPMTGAQLVQLCARAPKDNPAAPTHVTFNFGTAPFGASLAEFSAQRV